MYAVVKLAGKQWRVEENQKLLVDKLPVQKDEKILYRASTFIKKQR